MIGKLYKTLTPYYDKSSNATKIKSRPALIIAKADSTDYIILPLSTITHKNNIDTNYDVKIEPAQYPNLKLRQVSYIRTHKQTVINRASIGDAISDLKTDYEDLYLTILDKREEFNKEINEQALS